jgi:hypothetical protein
MASSVQPMQAAIRPDAIFNLAYLWHREFLKGQSEGRRGRPTLALSVAISDANRLIHVLALPITHSAPSNPRHAVQLPDITKRILGLDEDASFVVTTESVRFIWPGPDVRRAKGRTTPIYGFISSKLLQRIAQSYLENRKTGETVSFERTE